MTVIVTEGMRAGIYQFKNISWTAIHALTTTGALNRIDDYFPFHHKISFILQTKSVINFAQPKHNFDC